MGEEVRDIPTTFTIGSVEYHEAYMVAHRFLSGSVY